MKTLFSLFLVLALFFSGLSGNAQSNIRIRWAKNFPSIGPSNYFQMTPAVIKKNNRIGFYGDTYFNPLMVNSKGLLLPFDYSSFHFDWAFCAMSTFSSFNGAELMANGNVIRKVFSTYGMAQCDYFNTGYSVSTNEFSDFSFELESVKVKGLDVFKFRSDKNYSLKLREKFLNYETSIPCVNPSSIVLTFTSYSKNLDSIYRIEKNGFNFSGPAPKLNFSKSDRPVLSFWAKDTLNWNGNLYSVSQPGFSHFELDDSGNVASQYHTPIFPDSNFLGNISFGDKSLMVQFGKRKDRSGSWTGEISSLDSSGNKKWIFSDTSILNFSTAVVDPVGNGMFVFQKKGYDSKNGILILNAKGDSLWSYTIPDDPAGFNISLIQAVDTLEWALSGDFNNTLNLGAALVDTTASPLIRSNFAAFIGRQPKPQPFLTIDLSGKFCPGAEVELLVEEQALSLDSITRFFVQLSDSSGSFSFPLVLESSKLALKKFKLPNSIPGGGNYKLRIRSTFPDSIGPEKEIQIMPSPQKPVIASENGFSFCRGDSLILKNSKPFSNVEYSWSTGFSSDSTVVKNQGPITLNANIGSCYSKDSIYVTRLDSTSAICLLSIKDNSTSANLEIWPNPAKRKINIKGNWTGNSEIKLFNSFGQLVFDQNVILNDDGSELDLPASISTGFYLLKIFKDGKQISKNLVLE